MSRRVLSARSRAGMIDISRGLLQRQCACGQHTIGGGTCEACSAKRGATAWRDNPAVLDQIGDSGLPLRRAARAGADFSGLRAQAGDGRQFSDDTLGESVASPQVSSGLAEPAGEGRTDGKPQAEAPELAGPDAGAAQPMQAASKKGKVKSVDVITGSSGALTGFPTIPGGGNLDSPGPFNDLTTGSVKNIHQMKFTLDGTTSSEVSLIRTVNRTASAAGVQQTHNGPDGPSPTTVIRPNDATIAVADSPGYSGQGLTAPFPVTYNASFVLYAFDNVQKGIYAKLTYNVAISKQTLADPKPTNQITNIVKAIY